MMVTEGTILSLALVHLTVGDIKEKAIAAIEVEGGCHVRFARRHLFKHAATYDGAICRVTEVLSKDSTSMTKRRLHYKNKGCAFAVVESFESEVMPTEETSPPNKRQKFRELKYIYF